MAGGQYLCDFGEEGYMESSTHFGRRLLLSQEKVVESHEEQISVLMILVLF